MTWSLIAAWLIAHGLEFAAFVTTIIGIWLTTRRLLICWPIILFADFLYLVVFFRSGFLSDALLQIFFVVFTIYGWWHWWRGVVEEGEVRVVPLPLRGWLAGLAAGVKPQALLGAGAAVTAATPPIPPGQEQKDVMTEAASLQEYRIRRVLRAARQATDALDAIGG